MDALILSCSTGGGHNAAGFAIRDELLLRGHHVDMIDPYSLISQKLANQVGDTYVKMVQHSPKLFGFTYSLGSLVRRIPGQSPVYYANIQAAKKLEEYLEKHHYDVILMPHLFPAELVTYLKRHDVLLPLTVFIATDYVCIPFTEETDCDYYIIPSEKQLADFTRRKIPRRKLLPFGIPTDVAFDTDISREKAREILGLSPKEKIILLTGGSIGAGSIGKTVRILLNTFRKKDINGRVIVVCGSNEGLYRRLSFLYKNRLTLIRRTSRMALYMKACDIFISKPGGLSSTEAAVMRIPYIQITPIPGCESRNMRYFSRSGMSIGVKHIRLQLAGAVAALTNPKRVQNMRAAQAAGIPPHARVRICDWLEKTLTQ